MRKRLQCIAIVVMTMHNVEAIDAANYSGCTVHCRIIPCIPSAAFDNITAMYTLLPMLSCSLHVCCMYVCLHARMYVCMMYNNIHACIHVYIQKSILDLFSTLKTMVTELGAVIYTCEHEK